MLSYRHAFHAGNFADVMKHVVVTAILRYMTKKNAPLCYIDTHAGAGGYDLSSDRSEATQESESGIGLLWKASDAPEPVATYLDLVRRYNKTDALSKYPGSPWFAAQLLRSRDRLVLSELHNSDFPLLQKQFKRDRRVHCHAEDGYKLSIGLVPPLERRGLVLMDPAYELKNEYDTAIATIAGSHQRFATGTYAMWYPLLDDRRSAALKRAIDQLAIRDVLSLELQVTDRTSLSGMYGCGMLVINPPWTLKDDMKIALPYLASKLGRGGRGSFRIEQWVEE